MHKVLVFGNPLLRNDSLPLKLIARLAKRFPDIDFKEFDPAENLQDEGRNLNIIDTVEGIREVTLITDIDKIKRSPNYSVHDFDLGQNLKLLKKLHYMDSALIFGVPMKIGEKEAFAQLEELITASLS